LSKCQKPVKKKVKKWNGYSEADASRVVRSTHEGADFCEVFLSSTIFDAFKERLLLASAFNYNVDVGVINGLEGIMDLKYDVSFEPAPAGGLDEVEEVDMDPDEPIPSDPVCTESQCFTQKEVMRNIFNYFEVPTEEGKHQ